jgi:hypothetical protein
MTSAASIPVTIDNPAIDYDIMGGGNAGQGVQVLQTGGVTQPIMGSFLQHFSAGPAPFTVFPVDIFCTMSDATAITASGQPTGTGPTLASGGAVFQIPQFQGAGAGAKFIVAGIYFCPDSTAVQVTDSPSATAATRLQISARPRNCNGSTFPKVSIASLAISWITASTFVRGLTLEGGNFYGLPGLHTPFQVGDYIEIAQNGQYNVNCYTTGNVRFRLLLSRVA